MFYVLELIHDSTNPQVCAKSMYGVVSTYHHTWFVRWIDGGLQISDAIESTSAEPTLAAALHYIASLASQRLQGDRDPDSFPTEKQCPFVSVPTGKNEVETTAAKIDGGGGGSEGAEGGPKSSVQKALESLRLTSLADVGMALPGRDLPPVLGVGLEGAVRLGQVGQTPAAIKVRGTPLRISHTARRNHEHTGVPAHKKR